MQVDKVLQRFGRQITGLQKSPPPVLMWLYSPHNNFVSSASANNAPSCEQGANWNWKTTRNRLPFDVANSDLNVRIESMKRYIEPGLQNCSSLLAWLQENGERMKKWRGNGERFTLYISSFSLYFLPLYRFPISKIVSFCRKMLNTALLSPMSQTT